MNLGMAGKAPVVTGSTAGIGLAVATALATEGASVVVNGRTPARVAAAIEQIRRVVKDGRVRLVAAEPRCGERCQAFAPEVPDTDVRLSCSCGNLPDRGRHPRRQRRKR